MSQVITTLLGANRACDLADAAAKPVYGSLCGFAQMRFDFTEAILDRVEIGRVLRQITQRCTGRFNHLAYPGTLCEGRLSIMTTSRRLSVGTRNCLTHSTNVSPFIAPSITKGATMRSWRSPATNVIVFQCPCGSRPAARHAGSGLSTAPCWCWWQSRR